MSSAWSLSSAFFFFIRIVFTLSPLQIYFNLRFLFKLIFTVHGRNSRIYRELATSAQSQRLLSTDGMPGFASEENGGSSNDLRTPGKWIRKHAESSATHFPFLSTHLAMLDPTFMGCTPCTPLSKPRQPLSSTYSPLATLSSSSFVTKDTLKLKKIGQCRLDQSWVHTW